MLLCWLFYCVSQTTLYGTGDKVQQLRPASDDAAKQWCEVHERRDDYEISLGQQAGTLLYNWEVRRGVLCCSGCTGGQAPCVSSPGMFEATNPSACRTVGIALLQCMSPAAMSPVLAWAKLVFVSGTQRNMLAVFSYSEEGLPSHCTWLSGVTAPCRSQAPAETAVQCVQCLRTTRISIRSFC